MSDYTPEDMEREADADYDDGVMTHYYATHKQREMLRAGAQAMRDLAAAQARVKELIDTLHNLAFVADMCDHDVRRDNPEKADTLRKHIKVAAAALQVKP